jgi:hypothetical protein
MGKGGGGFRVDWGNEELMLWPQYNYMELPRGFPHEQMPSHLSIVESRWNFELKTSLLNQKNLSPDSSGFGEKNSSFGRLVLGSINPL